MKAIYPRAERSAKCHSKAFVLSRGKYDPRAIVMRFLSVDDKSKGFGLEIKLSLIASLDQKSMLI